MNKNNSNVLERLAAIDALNNNYEDSNYWQNTLNNDSKNRILAQEKNNSIDYQLADFCISSKDSASNIDNLNKRNNFETRNLVRLRIKPVHALSIMLILVVFLASSLTMLICQSRTYNKIYSYQAQRESKVKSLSKKFESNNKDDDEYSNDSKEDSKKDLHTNETKDLTVKNKDEDFSDNTHKINENDISKNNSVNKDKSGCININTAVLEELQTLKGIGPKMAQRILDMRKKLRVFKRVEDLMQVKGIGQKTFLKLKSATCVG